MTNITTLQPGEHFMFKNFEWVCLDPNHPDGGVLAIMAKPLVKKVKFCPSDKFADEKGFIDKTDISSLPFFHRMYFKLIKRNRPFLLTVCINIVRFWQRFFR